MTEASVRGRAVYADLTDTEKQAVREDIFRDLTSLDALVESITSGRLAGARDLLAELENFVTTNSADFTVAERQQLATARDRIAQRLATHANSWSRISGATVP